MSALPRRPASLVIAIETSAEAYASGAVRAYCAAVADALKRAAADAAADGSALRVAFLTYDRNVQVFFFRAAGALPLAHVLPAGGDAPPTLPKHTPPPFAELGDVLPQIEALLARLPDAPGASRSALRPCARRRAARAGARTRSHAPPPARSPPSPPPPATGSR